MLSAECPFELSTLSTELVKLGRPGGVSHGVWLHPVFPLTGRLVMDRITRIAIIQHAVRWAYNMLTEVGSNHGKMLSNKSREMLTKAIQALGECLSIGDDG